MNLSHSFKSLSDRNRKKKYTLFLKECAPRATDSILDVGASEHEYQKNANILEKSYPYQDKITVLGLDHYDEFHKRYPRVKTVTYDGSAFPFANKSFDVAHSNAVLEHVGGLEAQMFFLKEISRVAKKAFITTPNKYFPVELHTKIPLVHLIHKGAFECIARFAGKGWATGNYMNLLSLADIKKILSQCNISRYKIIKNRFLCFTVNFIIVFPANSSDEDTPNK